MDGRTEVLPSGSTGPRGWDGSEGSSGMQGDEGRPGPVQFQLQESVERGPRLRSGRPGYRMPSFGEKVSDDEVTQLVEWLRQAFPGT